MGTRGPAPTPTALLSPGSTKRYERTTEPMDTVAEPPMPAGMPAEAERHWRFIVPKLITRRTLTEADLGLLAIMCIEWAEYVDAVKDLAVLRESGQSYKGHLIDHPRVRMKGSFDRYKQAADRFGLSPAAKARVAASPEAKKSDPKDRFFGPRAAG